MCLWARFIPSSCHPWCVFERSLIVLCLSLSVFSLRRLPLLFNTPPALWPALHVDSAEGNTRCAFAQWGELPPGEKPSSHSTSTYLVPTRDVLSFALATSDSFPAKSTSVFWSTQCELCEICLTQCVSWLVVAQHSVYCARVVRHIRCLLLLPLLAIHPGDETVSSGLETRAHHGSGKSCVHLVPHNDQIPSDDVLESLYNLRIRESEQLKTVLELYDMENSSEDIDAQISEVADDGDQKLRLWNFDARH